ncbi:MAG: alpha/beta hydrolase [Lactobacillus sp.]|jgi:acetyl esterase/lipase|nr:alpha/beta hydrolase [Lactobacillus sp.]MCI2031956.1 alpha/beta hydrolase [Lactobacillus sp.]
MTKLQPAQRTPISPAARQMLAGFKYINIPSFVPITPRFVARIRTQFQAGEDVIEEGLIAAGQLTTTPVTFNGVSGLKITGPQTNDAGPVIVNVHGGGFIMGTARERTALLAATETNLPVYSVTYPLAPEGQAPAVVQQVLDFYRGVRALVGDRPIVMSGSSAGSGIAAAVVEQAHDQQVPLPAAMILFCPALDISGNGDSAIFNEKRDVGSAKMALRLAKLYIGDNDPCAPVVSPLYGEIGAWFPPTFMSTGTRDIMLSNVLRFSDKLQAAGVVHTAVIKEGMWHGFNWEPQLPEAVATRQAAWQFIQAHTEARH